MEPHESSLSSEVEPLGPEPSLLPEGWAPGAAKDEPSLDLEMLAQLLYVRDKGLQENNALKGPYANPTPGNCYVYLHANSYYTVFATCVLLSSNSACGVDFPQPRWSRITMLYFSGLK